MRKIIPICIFSILLCCNLCAAQSLKQVGIVDITVKDKTTGKDVPGYQTQVWMAVLNFPKRFTVKAISEDDLASADKLTPFSTIIVANSRAFLSQAQMDALKAYVNQGGKLVREGRAVESLLADKATAATVAAANTFWSEISGASVDCRFYNYATKFRYIPENKRLTRDLSDQLAEGDIPQDNRMARGVVAYKLSGASAVAEAEVMQLGTWSWDSEAKPLPGARTVVCVNKYGKGLCMSMGLAFPRAVSGNYGKISCEDYRTFCSNFISWCLE